MPARATRSTAARRATNVSLDGALLDQARALDINVSRACEEGLAAQVKQAREDRWRKDNAAAIEGWNAWVREHGLPLAKYRMF